MTSMTSMASIFCDGACPGNGTNHAFAGWAWAYWPGPARGEPTCYGAQKLENGLGGRPTNQRAELMALLESLRFAARHELRNVIVYTDSMYAINCTTKWGPGWKRKSWKRDSGEPLLNLDIIKPLVELWAKTKVPLQHVRGHQSGSGPEVHGNNWVDRAAVGAAHGSRLQKDDLIHDTIVHEPLETIPEEAPILVTVRKSMGGPVKQSDLRSWFTSLI